MNKALKYACLAVLLCIGANNLVLSAEPPPEDDEVAIVTTDPGPLTDSNNETVAEVTMSETPPEDGGVSSQVNATTGSNTTISQKLVKCLPGLGSTEVQLVNDTELIKLLLPTGNVTSRDVPANCILVLFYSKYCPFSAMAAPHFNALPRAFPDLKMVAINAMVYHLFNTQNGIVGVPSLVLFHNGRAVGRFNESEYTLELFSKFLTKHTGIAAAEKSHVTSADFAGPVTSVPSKDIDVYLIVAWAFILACGGFFFTKSDSWKWIVETVQRNWRESEQHAQHEHAE